MERIDPSPLDTLNRAIAIAEIFGAVPVEDYVRLMELHTRHHGKQVEDR